jgi:hypothetical protein
MHDAVMTAKAVRVSIPASVASNVDGLKKSIGSVLGRLGCPACCSGFDIRMELQRELMSASLEKGGRSSIGGWAGINTREVPKLTVGVSPSAVSKIEDVYLAIDKIAELSGHVACATGCDIFFQMEEMFVLDEKFNIEAPVLRLG